MARIKIAYIGGGSTRGAGTMSSFVAQGENFAGSEIVLVDLNQERLDLVRALAEKMVAAAGIDLKVTATTDRRAGLADCDAVLTSYRPGGFEARGLDERIPLAHGVIGQETQGPGGFFMALRSVHALKPILADMQDVCPRARIFNYTNPINLVSQAVCDNTDAQIVSLCEGPIVYPRIIARGVGLDPKGLDVQSVGLNHGSWSVKHSYRGRDLIALLREIWAERHDDPGIDTTAKRLLHIAVTQGSVPSAYFQYYYFEREILEELKAKPTTRSEDILAEVPGYWAHYREQLESGAPRLDPRRSRGGIHELELAIDCMDAVYNDRNEMLPVNVRNDGSVAGLPDELVVETLGTCNARGIAALKMPAVPQGGRGLVEALGEYQMLAAKAAWNGTAQDGVRALVANPLVRSLDIAERLYGAMAKAHSAYLPERLLAN
ncbi:MAG: glycoside hydrolase [Alphaproteobacteria bacterium]|nr:glycoside hydrolase [Alphaproteobacteria bacterium]